MLRAPKFYLCLWSEPTRERLFQLTLIYDNLVHLIIATDCGQRAANALSPARFGPVNGQPILFCVKHFHFQFPLKFNANLLAGQAAFWGAPELFRHHLSWSPSTGARFAGCWVRRRVFVGQVGQAHNQHIGFIISTVRYIWIQFVVRFIYIHIYINKYIFFVQRFLGSLTARAAH